MMTNKILTPFLDDYDVLVYKGDCIEVMRDLPESSVDAIVTDPPYGLEFMGREWDGFGTPLGFQTWTESWAREAFRVLKPGGHLLAFAGTRTYHRMASGVEDAGFEIRDCIAWMYGSGFPKSLDVSKALDKAAGAEREIVGTRKGVTVSTEDNQYGGINRGAVGIKQTAIDVDVTIAATDEARTWSGWGTALKPAFEPIVVARKPLIGTVAQNVLEHGTGALNIDGCRIDMGDEYDPDKMQRQSRSDGAVKFASDGLIGKEIATYKPGGRWPANVALDDTAAAMLDTSRFFYTAKASRQDRNAGGLADNTHPTVKPTELMRWLVRLVTPPGGIVLDPFGGSGSTGLACRAENTRCILIERENEYLNIIRDRLAQLSLFSEESRLDDGAE